MSILRTPEKWTPQGFTKHIGFHDFRLTAEGDVTVELDVAEHHLNMGGIVHGGVMLSLLDSAMGGAVVTKLEDGEWTATESLTTNFLRPGGVGRLHARGRVEKRGKLTAFVTGVVTDADGKVVAMATGVWAIRRG